jgi:predicted RNA binding protein YcfA (HicA-like mRNA interferase family)
MKAMARRLVEKALRKAGCRRVSQDGSHDKWGCPCGSHSTAVPRHTTISPGVIRNIIRDLACLPGGWLQ